MTQPTSKSTRTCKMCGWSGDVEIHIGIWSIYFTCPACGAVNEMEEDREKKDKSQDDTEVR